MIYARCPHAQNGQKESSNYDPWYHRTSNYDPWHYRTSYYDPWYHRTKVIKGRSEMQRMRKVHHGMCAATNKLRWIEVVHSTRSSETYKYPKRKRNSSLNTTNGILAEIESG
jgi:hypothetical protein